MNPLETQMEMSQRLCKMMLEDHEERIKSNLHLYEIVDSLMKKLEERDAKIVELRNKLTAISGVINA